MRVLAGWLTHLSDAIGHISRTILIVAVAVCAGVVGFTVFTRYVLGFSLTGHDELASYAFLWVIWMGVSLAVPPAVA